jgi:hypothetical protein
MKIKVLLRYKGGTRSQIWMPAPTLAGAGRFRSENEIARIHVAGIQALEHQRVAAKIKFQPPACFDGQLHELIEI